MQTGFPKKCTTRTAEELIALGDQTSEIFSDAEMNVLFQQLCEKNIGARFYRENEWVLLQWHLRRRGISGITVFSDEKMCVVELSNSLSIVFQRLWRNHASEPGYKKMEWKVFRRQLSLRSIFV